MTKEQKNNIYDNLLKGMCYKYNCNWWDIIDSDKCEELDNKVDMLDLNDNDYNEWLNNYYEEL